MSDKRPGYTLGTLSIWLGVGVWWFVWGAKGFWWGVLYGLFWEVWLGYRVAKYLLTGGV